VTEGSTHVIRSSTLQSRVSAAGSRVAARRLREWVLLRAFVLDENWREEDLTSASDWLQRRACAEPAAPAALAVLAARGRTRRVRAAALRARERA
jgi:hypothetical protein